MALHPLVMTEIIVHNITFEIDFFTIESMIYYPEISFLGDMGLTL